MRFTRAGGGNGRPDSGLKATMLLFRVSGLVKSGNRHASGFGCSPRPLGASATAIRDDQPHDPPIASTSKGPTVILAVFLALLPVAFNSAVPALT
jgi:hypothetical protein